MEVESITSVTSVTSVPAPRIMPENMGTSSQGKQNSTYVPTVQEKTVLRAVEEANRKFFGGDREFEFAIHEKTKEIMVKIIDIHTKEVVREIPSEKILDMVAGFMEAAGLFVDEKR